ncbi:MAG: PHP domain-containing protein [Bacteroidota bacterium]
MPADSGTKTGKTKPTGKADLHIHSTYSDGVHSPFELVKKAAEAGLRAISITDHDSITGIDESIRYGIEYQLTVIPGIEFSATNNGREVHIIGYFFDRTNHRLTSALTFLRNERLKRAERIIGKLNRLNIPVTMDDVLEVSRAGSVGRPHIATAMVEKGYAESFSQVFIKYIGENGPAYEKKSELSSQEVIDLISHAGGLSILAHPGKSMTERDLLLLIEAGIDGIEVIHPSHMEDQIKYYRAIVNQYYLVETGGSDYHGGLRGDDQNLGRVYVPLEVIDHLRRRLPIST